MAVPAVVASAFKVVDAECVFEFSVVLFDPPARLAEARELVDRCVGWQVAQPVLAGPVGAVRPLQDEKL